jgi:ParB/RepB/Spo0J family partition protein
MNTHVSITAARVTTLPLAIRMLALKSIDPSGTAVQQRRRAHYDDTTLKELAENIKAVQVIEPIIVRPKADRQGAERFEIVAGERRWRASGQAGLDTIPAIVRTLDDAQVLEIQLVENLHREGLHELEEAEGYETLMQKHGYDIEGLVAKLGRSRAYVYARLKLLALDKKSREAFYKGQLNASTALLLARIPIPGLQQQALKAITDGGRGEPLSFREAQRHIQEHFMLRLKEAPFDHRDATLLPTAGPCLTCPKRTGNQPELFGDVKSADVCTDPECFAAKRAAWSQRIEEQAKAEGRTVLSRTEAQRIAPYGAHSTLQGGYVALDQRCYEDEKGRTYRQLLGKAFKAETLMHDPKSGHLIELVKLSAHTEALKAKGVRAERPKGGDKKAHERQQAAKFETQCRERIFNVIRAKTPAAIAGAELRLVAETLWKLAGHESRLRLVSLWKWADKTKASDVVYRSPVHIVKLPEAELRRFVIDCSLIQEVRTGQWDTSKPEALLQTAKRLRIDTDSIRKALKAEVVAKHAARAGRRTEAKSRDKKAPSKKTAIA